MSDEEKRQQEAEVAKNVQAKLNEDPYAKFKSKRQLTKEERKKLLKERRHVKKENKSVGITNDILHQTDYYFENGLRKVYPYYFGWNTTAKERWYYILTWILDRLTSSNFKDSAVFFC